jgi:tetratricopeptide (TPR) repeat protein
MRYCMRIFFAWGLLLFPAFFVSAKAQTGTNAAPATEAVLLTAEGRVEWQAVGRNDWSPVRPDQRFRPREKVRTGLKSRATMRMADQTVASLKPLTTVEIPALGQDNRRTLIDLREGAAFFYNREGAAQTTFRTPTASGAIRGTEFHLAVDQLGNTVLTMLDGVVDLSNELGEVRVVSGEQGVVEAGRAPRKTAVLDAINIIQWALYYPAILDWNELGLADADGQQLQGSTSAYRQGDLVGAAGGLPEGYQAALAPAQIYQAATLLFVGEVDGSLAILEKIQAEPNSKDARLAAALRELIAAVKFQDFTGSANPELATEWMARSYYLQSRGQLEAARAAARNAVKKSPDFGFGWARLAELEFSFGQTGDALKAAEKALSLTPRNAQARVVEGFLLSAQNRRSEARAKFDQAIEIDPNLGNAWLGRGLSRIRQGEIHEGRQDLQTALALEPNRAVLRAYAGKAHHQEGNEQLARKEFDLAKRLDPKDPSSFLYAALLNQQENRLNEAVRDLETSQDLNENRSVFRSRLLLDQDRAVRSANLASIYRDNGMVEVSVLEASRAVNYDYGNYSAHLFLANSYDSLRDPRQVNLRYETPWLSELLIANLLQPVGGGSLSQNISQQEYSRFFEGNRFGFISLSEYFSNGDWFQRASQYGHYDNTAYSIDANYNSINGWRENNDSEALTTSIKIKQQITPKDSVYFQALYYNFESGDVWTRYDQTRTSTGVRVKERQEPLLFAGYNHEWSPGVNTLLFVGAFDDTVLVSDPQVSANVLLERFRIEQGHRVPLQYRSELRGYSTELQQIWGVTDHNIIAGGRFQSGENDTTVDAAIPARFIGQLPAPLRQEVETDIQRYNFYLYDHWRMTDRLLLIGGISYDHLEYPVNINVAPITADEGERSQLSPKVGFIFEPWKNGFFRGMYTHSLGGVFFDNSFRLEPVQIAGFTQAYRSIIPESAVQNVIPGARFETFGLGFDQRLWKNTYVTIEGEILNSTADLSSGAFSYSGPFDLTATAISYSDHLDYSEKSLRLSVHQLIGKDWSIGARYRLTHADLDHRFDGFPLNTLNGEEEADLHQINLYAIYNLPCGFFSQFHSIWTQQSAKGLLAGLPGDDFWHLNAFAGYRFFQRRAEVRVGLLNLTDQDYQLHPITLYNELPRERTFYASLKLNF